MPNQAQIHAKYWTYMLVYLCDSHLKHVHSQHDSICYSIKLKNTKYLFSPSGTMYISGFHKIVS